MLEIEVTILLSYLEYYFYSVIYSDEYYFMALINPTLYKQSNEVY